MDVQIENAVKIGYDRNASRDLKGQAVEFLQGIRLVPTVWPACLQLAVRQPKVDEVVQVVALDLLNSAIRGGTAQMEDMVYIRDQVMTYIRVEYCPGAASKMSFPILSKFAQTLTFLFEKLYQAVWPGFFEDLQGIAGTKLSDIDNTAGTKLYLRVVNSVHDEIGDTIISRTQEEQQRSNDLKDLVRERDAARLATSWAEILVKWKSKDPTICYDCLSAVGRWSTWMDLSLIIRDPLLSLIFELVRTSPAQGIEDAMHGLQDTAVSTVTSILEKKMKASDKVELIEILKIRDILQHLTESPSLSELRDSPLYDTDLAEVVANLVNSAIVDVVGVLDDPKLDDAIRSRASSQLQAFVPFALRFFSDEYDEISSTVIPSMTDILSYVRKRGKDNTPHSDLLGPILQAIIAKMKYDDTSEWGDEDERSEEADFLDLRKRLNVLQQAVAAVDEDLFIGTISRVVVGTFEQFQKHQGQINWREVDLALHEMYLFGELAVKGGGLYSKTKPVSVAAEQLIGMMYKFMELDVPLFTHPALQLQYMEICVRYCSFFEHNQQLIPSVLENFVKLVHHDHIKVRRRSWYLFHRFVKPLRQYLGGVAQRVIEAIADLLPIRAELPEANSDEDDMSSEDNTQSVDTVFISQLYLYESVGCLSSAQGVVESDRVLFVQGILAPLISDLQNYLTPARNGDERAKLQIHHVISAAGTLSRGYLDATPGSMTSNSTTIPLPVAAEFEKAAEAILVVLETLNDSMEIRTASRNAFSRLVGVLGSKVLPQLPRWIQGLLSQTSSKDEMAMFLRLLNQVIYGFKTEIYNILNMLLTPFLQRVFAGLTEPSTGTDDAIQLAELKGQYLSFLLVLLNNDLGAVLVSAENQGIFETVISTIEHFTKDNADYPNAKLAFSSLTRMITYWGGPDLSPSTPTAPQPTLPGFDSFMMTRFSPLSWSLAGNPAFNPKDAQGKQVLGEAATMQKALYSKTGSVYIDWLRGTELRGMGMDEATIAEYVRELTQADAKKFRTFFQRLVVEKRR